MNVLLLANEIQKEEFLFLSVSNTVQLTWIPAIDGLMQDQHFDVCIDLLFDNTVSRMKRIKNLNAAINVVNSVIHPLKDIEPGFIRINGWNSFLKRSVLEAATNHAASKTNVEETFLKFGRTIEWVPDIAGFITPRIIASVINEAFFALEENVSTTGEIDIAMKLGTNYPFGPFEWSKNIGLKNIYFLLDELSKEQPRYQPSSLLKQTALQL